MPRARKPAPKKARAQVRAADMPATTTAERDARFRAVMLEAAAAAPTEKGRQFFMTLADGEYAEFEPAAEPQPNTQEKPAGGRVVGDGRRRSLPPAR